jgi:hypothetical protein
MSNAKIAIVASGLKRTDDVGTHISTDWEFSDLPDMSNITYSSYNDTVNLHSIVYTGPLYLNTGGDLELVYFRTRFNFSNTSSDWSDINVYSIEY